MSSLWTPEGEHRVPGRGPAGPGADDHDSPRAAEPGGRGDDTTVAGHAVSEEEQAAAAHLEELRRQLLSAPVEVVVANHAYGLFELAAIHLSQRPPGLEQARLAVDALGALVEGLAGRLGEVEASLVDALGQIRLAFVQISQTEES